MPIDIGAAMPGLSRLAMAIGGGGAPGGAYQKGYDAELGLQSKLAQAIAAQQASQATARLHGLQADAEQAHADARKPDAVLNSTLTANSIPTDEAGAVSDFLKTGQLGGAYRPLAPDQAGPVAAAPDWASRLGAVARQVGALTQAGALGDKNIENVAKAEGLRRDQQLSDSVISGSLPRNAVAGGQAAASGKPMYHTDGNGSVLDLFAGGVNTDNPMARSTIGLRDQQAGQAQAGAAAHYAQGRAADALTAQRQQVTANGPGPGKMPVGYRYTTGADGEARLEPIPGGPKDPNAQTGKPLPASAAKGYLDNIQNLSRAQKALDLVQGKNIGEANGDEEATGWKGYLPNALLNRVDPAGVDTRAAIADLGSLVIHDRSGAAVTASEFPRLAPFIPTAHDDAATVQKKLKLFVQNYRAIVDDSAEFYKSSGYNVPALTRTHPAAVAPRATSAAPAAPGGFTYLGKE